MARTGRGGTNCSAATRAWEYAEHDGVRGHHLISGAFVVLATFVCGCSSHRFQLANARGRGSNDAFAATAAPRVPASPTPSPLISSGLPPATTVPAIAAAEPRLSDNPNPGIAGVGNRRLVTETPRPGPVGSPLEPATSGPDLVGRVVDPLGRPEPNAPVRVLDLSRAGQVAAEVATDGDGRFEVRNLQPGTQYELIAVRSAVGQRLAGSTIAVPPNTSVLIQVASEYASTISPRGNRLDTPIPARPSSLPPIGVYGNVTVSTPAILGQSQPATPAVMIRPQQSSASAAPSPAISPKEPLPQPAPITSDPAPATPSAPAAKSLAFVGTGLENASVTTLDMQTRRLGELDGDLIILDFFGSWCGPCRRSIPMLNGLHRRYGSRGIQVVGVACEHGSLQQAVGSAERVRRDLAIEYGVVVTALESPSVVRDYFRVQAYPTLVLLDRRGTILFHHVGGDEAGLSRLDATIQQALARR